MNLDRRNLVKAAAMAAASAAAATRASALSPPTPPSGPRLFPDPAPDTDDATTWDKAPCRFCGTGCHVQVGTQDGRVVAIRGDEEAEVNKGLLCVKGYHVGEILYGRDRLTTPLLKKDGKHVPISWDEALTIVADRIAADPAGFAFYGSGQWTIPEGYAANKFMKGGLGNNHIDPNARLCMASAVTGFLATYGVDEPASCFDDLDECDVLLLWGNNAAEMHPVAFSRVIDRKLRGSKVRIIDLGTRRTRTTDFADDFLLFRPQTDMVIANGIAHLLLAEWKHDADFVQQHCSFRKDNDPLDLFGQPMSFEEYKEALALYTPEYVEQLSGVSQADLRMLAGLFADRNLRITSLWCMGMNQHTRGTAVNTQVHGIHLLSGHWGRPGDGPTSLTGQPSACGTVREVGTLCHTLPGGRLVAKEPHRKSSEELWNLPAGRINPKPGYHTVAMWEHFVKPADQGGDISTLWVQVTNPGQSLPNTSELFFGRAEDKFLIVSDVYPTVSTAEADLILPSALWVEKNGIFGNSERRTQTWFKQVDPPGDARDDCWQTIAVARKLYDLGFAGMKDKDGAFLFDVKDAAGKSVPVWDWEHYYDVNVDEYLFEEYRPFTRMKHKDLAPYQTYANARGLRWPVVQTDDGAWRETKWRFVEGYDPYVEPGKGIQFYHSTTGDDRAQIWFRPYEPPPEMPDGDYPFWLCTGRVLEQWHTASMTDRVPQLHAAMPSGYAELNTGDAARLGVRTGDPVTVTTRRGEVELPAVVGGRGEPPPGSIFVPFFDDERQINLTTLEAYCPISKQPDYKKCAARLTKVSS